MFDALLFIKLLVTDQKDKVTLLLQTIAKNWDLSIAKKNQREIKENLYI